MFTPLFNVVQFSSNRAHLRRCVHLQSSNLFMAVLRSCTCLGAAWHVIACMIASNALAWCSMTNKGTARVDAYVDLDYFNVVHTDTATYDELPDDPDNVAQEGEPANQIHLAQTHEIVVRIGEQLTLIRGEQRHFRKR